MRLLQILSAIELQVTNAPNAENRFARSYIKFVLDTAAIAALSGQSIQEGQLQRWQTMPLDNPDMYILEAVEIKDRPAGGGVERVATLKSAPLDLPANFGIKGVFIYNSQNEPRPIGYNPNMPDIYYHQQLAWPSPCYTRRGAELLFFNLPLAKEALVQMASVTQLDVNGNPLPDFEYPLPDSLVMQAIQMTVAILRQERMMPDDKNADFRKPSGGGVPNRR